MKRIVPSICSFFRAFAKSVCICHLLSAILGLALSLITILWLAVLVTDVLLILAFGWSGQCTCTGQQAQ